MTKLPKFLEQKRDSEIKKNCPDFESDFISGFDSGALEVKAMAEKILLEALEKSNAMMPGMTEDPTWPVRTIGYALQAWKEMWGEK